MARVFASEIYGSLFSGGLILGGAYYRHFAAVFFLLLQKGSHCSVTAITASLGQ